MKWQMGMGRSEKNILEGRIIKKEHSRTHHKTIEGKNMSLPNSRGRHNLPENTMTSTYLRNSLWILKSCQSPRRADSSQLTFKFPMLERRARVTERQREEAVL